MFIGSASGEPDHANLLRNITVAVEPELYRQTRKIAADYDTTVTDMVRFLLMVLPDAVKDARYPGGRPQFGLVAARTVAPAPPAAPTPNLTALPGKMRKIGLYACKRHQPDSLQQKPCNSETGSRTK